MQQMQRQTTLINQDVVPVLSRLSELRGFAGEFRVYEVGQFVNLDDPERYAMFFKRMDEIRPSTSKRKSCWTPRSAPARRCRPNTRS